VNTGARHPVTVSVPRKKECGEAFGVSRRKRWRRERRCHRLSRSMIKLTTLARTLPQRLGLGAVDVSPGH
jgi:hypothetical protein